MIEKKIKDVMIKTFNCHFSEINKNLSIGKIKAWDSLNHYKLVSNLERKFKIKFDDGEAETLTSFKIILSTIKSYCDE